MSRILVLGASGMLGNAMIRVMLEKHEAWGTVRNEANKSFFDAAIAKRIKITGDIENPDTLTGILADVRPEVVINCIGLIKQRKDADDLALALPINAELPHRLEKLCAGLSARLIHISTDCVFSGKKGNYRESDTPDAEDAYGRSKLLGEVIDAPHAVTLRTSIIGHEIGSARGLVEWFLAQKNRVKGYKRAIFSGLPTVELAQVIRDNVLTNAALSGLYHVASAPISKFDLLTLVKAVYEKDIEIDADGSVAIDRSLNAEKFRTATGYVAAGWPELVKRMRAFK